MMATRAELRRMAVRGELKRTYCRKCGKRVWWRRCATDAISGEPWFKWCARIGSKPAPIDCPKGGYHDVLGDARAV
jgi:hypothetical protein